MHRRLLFVAIAGLALLIATAGAANADGLGHLGLAAADRLVPFGGDVCNASR
jgi:hypothetical protein